MRRFFHLITSFPITVLCVAAVLAGLAGMFMLRLTRDTSPDAFIPDDHHALVLKREVEETFGLRDPIAVGVIRDAEGGIFNPHSLRLIRQLTVDIQNLVEVDPADVLSLATESGVFFEDGEPGFELLLKGIPETPEGIAALRNEVLGYELYRGTLVAADGSAACILIRPPDARSADGMYRALADLVDDYPVRDERLVVAGEAAVRAHMGQAVSDDALRMNFVCPVVMAGLIVLAYRSVRGTVLPLCVIGGASALALGAMAAAGVPVYIVTNGIFVIIMALGVADSLHLIGQYYEEQLELAGRTKQQLIVDACMALWYPVLITSLTDVAGFFALYATGTMPPIRYFGLFTCIGVIGALLYSYTVVPAGLMIRPLRMSRAFAARRNLPTRYGATDWIGRVMAGLGAVVLNRRGAVVGLTVLIIGAGAWGASRVQVNDARVLAFKEHHPIVQANRALNRHFDGTNQLNVVLTGSGAGAFLQPENLHRIEELEAFTESLPHVGGTHSLAGWVKRAHQKMNHEDPAFYAIPEDAFDTQFYLDTLGLSTSPMRRLLREVVDESYTETNLIVRMRSGEFIHQHDVITRLQTYLDRNFDTQESTAGGGESHGTTAAALKARITGRANLDYHWLKLIGRSHRNSVILSFACVLLLTAIMFRSFLAGMLCTLTVGIAVLVNYAVMGFAGIPLGVGTSMFASIAIGAGVNFPIHMLDRLRVGIRNPDSNVAEVFRGAYAFTGRALFFTAFVVAVGFLLLCVSEFRTLIRFGLLIGVGMLVSFAASVTVLPALVALLRPRFIWERRSRSTVDDSAQLDSALASP